jgi:hypothetical protein
MLQGFIEHAGSFYFLFLAPIMIAYANRASQMVTPAATIITVNITLASIMDYIATVIIIGFVDNLTQNGQIRRIPPILAIVVSLLILRPVIVDEYKTRDRSLSTLVKTAEVDFVDTDVLRGSSYPHKSLIDSSNAGNHFNTVIGPSSP